MVDDPLIPRGPGSRPYDGEGLASRKNVVVDTGVLKTYLSTAIGAQARARANGCAGRGVGGAPHVTTSNFILQKGTTKPRRSSATSRAGCT